MFAGEKINVTEERAVLHVALRAPARRTVIEVDGVDVVPEVHAVLDAMAGFADADPLGVVDRATPASPSATVVNIGIGGSDLGPAMAYEALRELQRPRPHLPLRVQHRRHRLLGGHPRPRPGRDAVHRGVQDLHHPRDDDQRRDRPRLAASAARGDDVGVAKHFVAVSTNHDGGGRRSASTPANMFGFWDWVGGRYSYDSAVGLSLMIAIGPDQFGEMLAGFHAMDEPLPHRADRGATCRC